MKDDFALSKEVIPKTERKVSIIKSIFKPKERKHNIPNYNGSSLFDTKLYRVGDVVKLNSIYYESNTWKLNNLSEREFDRLVATMNRYPNMIVEVRSHTDSRGNADVNAALSRRRVNEVVKYLERRKIDSRRIKGLGMGESQPINKCGDGMQCTEAEYQQNRRTEFKVLQIEKIF
jgi:outer membrane protein OmpA-like peptidoglycan-associated protein